MRAVGTLEREWIAGRWLRDGFALLLLVFLGGACEPRPPAVPGFTHIEKNAQGFHEYRHEETDIVMVLLPGGKFWMGSTGEERRWAGERFLEESADESREVIEAGIASEAPRHEVKLSSFLIAKYEVSQEQYRQVMKHNPSAFKPGGSLNAGLGPSLREDKGWLDLPADSITWLQCQEFCEKTGLALPSEAQWEYACRGGAQTRYCFGDEVSADQVNFFGARPRPVVVDSFPPNAYGLHHLHGNVREWCADVFDPGFYSKEEARGPDPLCTEGSEYRVRRGGSWAHEAVTCRSAARGWEKPTYSHYDLGFRPVHPAGDE